MFANLTWKIHEDNTLYAFEWVEKYFSLLTWVSNYYNYYTHDLSVYQQWLLPSLIYLGRFNCSYNHSYITYCIIILHFCCAVFLLFVLCGVSNNIQIGIMCIGIQLHCVRVWMDIATTTSAKLLIFTNFGWHDDDVDVKWPRKVHERGLHYHCLLDTFKTCTES